MADEEEVDVTADDVRDAERAAEQAERQEATLKHRLTSGVDTPSAEDIDIAEKLARHAKLAAEGVRARFGRTMERRRKAAVAELAAEIRDGLSTNSNALSKAFIALEKAAREFDRLAKEHDQRLSDWVTRAHNLDIKPGTSEQGIGYNGINQLVFEGNTREFAEGGSHLATMFGSNARLQLRDTADLAAAKRYLNDIGKGL